MCGACQRSPTCPVSEKLDLPGLGLFPYFDFRSQSKQGKLNESAWAEIVAFANGLSKQAYPLANKEKKKPKQASLRRAVLTAYYALFHLLIDGAVSQWAVERQRSVCEDFRQGLL